MGTPLERAKAKLTNQLLPKSKITKANPAVRQGCGAFKCRSGGRHSGIDLLATNGTKILSPGDGVAYIGYLANYGKTILIDHGDKVETRFAHLSSYSVKNKVKISAGKEIGAVGRTGNTPAGGQTHLHFEIIVDGKKIDPASVFSWVQDK